MLQLVQFVHSPVHPSDPSFCLTRLTRPTRPSIRLPTFRTFRTAAPLRLELLKLNDITFSCRGNSAGRPKEFQRNSKSLTDKGAYTAPYITLNTYPYSESSSPSTDTGRGKRLSHCVMYTRVNTGFFMTSHAACAAMAKRI